MVKLHFWTSNGKFLKSMQQSIVSVFLEKEKKLTSQTIFRLCAILSEFKDTFGTELFPPVIFGRSSGILKSNRRIFVTVQVLTEWSFFASFDQGSCYLFKNALLFHPSPSNAMSKLRRNCICQFSTQYMGSGLGESEFVFSSCPKTFAHDCSLLIVSRNLVFMPLSGFVSSTSPC